MAELPGPFSALELGDGKSTSFRVLDFLQGERLITPEHAPQGKRVTQLRVFVPPEDKPDFPHYWDLTQAKLIAQLSGHLQLLKGTGRRVTITAYGFPPKKYFSVALEGA